MEGLVGFAVVDVMPQLHVVTSLLTSARRPRRLTWRLVATDNGLWGRSEAHNVLGLVSLVDIALTRPQGQLRLRVLRVAVVEVNKEFLKV